MMREERMISYFIGFEFTGDALLRSIGSGGKKVGKSSR